MRNNIICYHYMHNKEHLVIDIILLAAIHLTYIFSSIEG